LAGGASVALASNNALLTVPASVTVAAGATTATFNATAAAAIAANQNASVTATYGPSSQSATLALLAPVLVSALGCAPASLGQSAVSSCTVTLSQPALAGGASVALASNNALLTVPASVTVTAGATTATFGATAAAAIAVNQNASVTATYGASSQSATIALQAALVSALSCNPKGSLSGGSTVCTITLSQSVSAPTSISLSSDSSFLSIPATVIVPVGSAAVTATATIGAVTADSAATVSATLGASSQSAKVIMWPTPTVTSLTCTPATISVGSSTTCTLTVSQGTGTLEAVKVTSGNAALSVPGTVNVLSGQPTAGFLAQAKAAVGAVVLTATYNNSSVSTIVTTQANSLSSAVSATLGLKSGSSGKPGMAQLKSLACTPASPRVRTRAVCRIETAGAAGASGAELSLSSSDVSLRLPASVTVRPGQTAARFEVEAASASVASATITVRSGDDIIQAELALDGQPPQLQVPRRVYARYGAAVQFRVRSIVSDDASLTASDLPSGAILDSVSGIFHWTPDVTQQGTHKVVFTATTAAGDRTTATSEIEVDSGTPEIRRVLNAASRSTETACSPGAIASLEGRWLTAGEPTSDPTGESTELTGTSVTINGTLVPILAASATRVDFLCPAVPSESTLEITLRTPFGIAGPVQTVSKQASPGIFSIDDSDQGQGAIFHAGTATFAMTPNYRYTARTAVPGEELTIYATGLGTQEGLSVVLGETTIVPQSVTADSVMAGISRISFLVPSAVRDEIAAVFLKVANPDGSSATSNVVTISTDKSGQ
jgi:uncharacterized protein (TIGR03437 family)